MIKCIIVEDERKVREALKKMLKLVCPSIQVINETGFVKKAIEIIKIDKPDLVFLDIKLEDGTGFDLLEQIESINFKIIFTTAYNTYALNVFKFSAIDYLLKPIDPLKLKASVDRAVDMIQEDKAQQKLIEVLKENYKTQHKTIVLRTMGQQYFIKLNDIIRLEADGAYTSFFTVNTNIVVSKNLKYYQNLLDDSFIRSHQSHLVNSKHIQGLDKSGLIIMTNGDLVPISTRKKSDIIQKIGLN